MLHFERGSEKSKLYISWALRIRASWLADLADPGLNQEGLTILDLNTGHFLEARGSVGSSSKGYYTTPTDTLGSGVKEQLITAIQILFAL